MHAIRRFLGFVPPLLACTLVALALSLASCGGGGGGGSKVKLRSIAITPPAPSIAVGFSQTLVATGLYSDRTTRDITATLTWSVSDPARAAVGNAPGSYGRVTTLSVGAVTITATDGATGSSATIRMTITPAVLVGLEISPPSASIARGFSQSFLATGIFSDRTTKNLTDAVTWSSADPSIATIGSSAGTHGLAQASSVGTTILTARHTASGFEATAGFGVTPAVLQSLAIDPPAPRVALGYVQRFTAIGTFSDHTTQDLSATVTWSSSSTAIATIDNGGATNGVASGGAVGQTTITATDPSTSIFGSTSLEVLPAELVSIALDPPASSVALGRTQQLTATGIFSDGSTADLTEAVTWESSLPSVATISNAVESQGLATSAQVGSTTITATDPQTLVAGTTTLEVSPAVIVAIGVDPTNPSIALGYVQQFTATATYSDNTTGDVTHLVTWSTSQAATATVGNAATDHGLATSFAQGNTTITATDPSTSVAGSTDLAVTPAVLVSIEVAPATPSIALGYAQPFTAVGTFSDRTTQDITAEVTWESSNLAAATVSNASGARGLASSAGIGSTTISATDPSTSLSGSTTLQVTPAILVSLEVHPSATEIALGFHQQFTAIGTFSDQTTRDLTTAVTWSSSNSSAVAISNAAASEGFATTAAEGSTTITATDVAANVSGSTTLRVTPAVLISIAVDPALSTIALGYEQRFTATGTFSDNSVQDITSDVTWTTSSSSIATVSNAGPLRGLSTSIAEGRVAITATEPSRNVVGSATLIVSPAVLVSVSVEPAVPTIALGYDRQFTAMGTFSDHSVLDITDTVTWTSSNTAAATISNASGNRGLATSAGLGATDITARDAATNLSGTTTLTVSAAVLLSIAVEPAVPQIALGYAQQFTATGTFSDQTTRDLTSSVTWSSSNPGAATISNASGSEGTATSTGLGSSTITATDASTSLSGATTLLVSEAVLVAISVDPPSPSISLGYTQQFTATGTFSDNTSRDVTHAVTWTSSNTAAATISNATGSAGLATSAAQGSTTITATDAVTNVAGSASLLVSPAALLSIAVDPPSPQIAVGFEQRFTATGTYSDNTTRDVSTSVTWSSSNTSIATIANAPGSEGLASALTAGSTSITATDVSTSIAGSTTLLVNGAVLVSIAVEPSTPSVALGRGQQFLARGTFSDTTVRDITTSVTWSSSSPAIATISNSSGNEGYATSASQGTTTITATEPGTSVAGSTTLDVTPALLLSIAVEPSNPSIALGHGQQFTARGTYSDNTTQDLTGSVTWSSSATGIATISNAIGSQGLATSVAQGSTTIEAQHVATGFSASTTLSVGEPIVYRNQSYATSTLNELALTLPVPIAVAPGETMIAAIAVRPRNVVITAPSGWTLARRSNNTPPNPSSLAIYYRVASASEPASYTWSFDDAHGSVGAILSFQGPNAASPFDVHDGTPTVQSLTHVTPSITTTVPNTLIVTFHAMSSSASWTAPAGMIERLDVASETIPSSSGMALLICTQFQSAAGSTGTRSATASNNQATGNACIFALRP